MSATYREQSTLEPIDRAAVKARAAGFKAEGFRLVQISCVRLESGFEITYSFDKATALKNLRIVLPVGDATVASITDSYFCAFTYENELKDLFGIAVDGLALDFKGNFYRKAQAAPFAKSFTVNTTGSTSSN